MPATLAEAVRKDTFEYIHISRYKGKQRVGFECDCLCPECGEPVGTRIHLDGKSDCFVHAPEVVCTGGALETQLHKFAKQLFTVTERKALVTPRFGTPNELARFAYMDAALEKKTGVLRPDIVLTDAAGHQLIVEITVTHSTFDKPEKMARLKELGTPAIEIELDPTMVLDLDPGAITFDEFQELYADAILNSVHGKRWLVEPDAAFSLIREKQGLSTGETVLLIVVAVGSAVVAFSPKLRRKAVKIIRRFLGLR